MSRISNKNESWSSVEEEEEEEEVVVVSCERQSLLVGHRHHHRRRHCTATGIIKHTNSRTTSRTHYSGMAIAFAALLLILLLAGVTTIIIVYHIPNENYTTNTDTTATAEILLMASSLEPELAPENPPVPLQIDQNHHRSNHKHHNTTTKYHQFPATFVWGAATSSYQIEGAVTDGNRSPSIWDTYCAPQNTNTTQHILDGSSGAVACDHYHRLVEDVQLMQRLGLKAYRFSIAWTRIIQFPTMNDNGNITDADADADADADTTVRINMEGIDFYNRLIDELMINDITPWVTLYHWDLPQVLEDKYGGWLSPAIIQDFGTYAKVCYAQFGDRVQHWITINEAWSTAVQGYEDGTKAPGHTQNPRYDVYTVAHHQLLAHAHAVRIYREHFAPVQRGKIGLANNGDYRYPLHPQSPSDVKAAERAMVFQYGWLSDPVIFGDYPREMKQRLGDRLPQFTPKQREELTMSVDFLGLNHYSTLYATSAATAAASATDGGYWTDMAVEFSSNPLWHTNYMGWSTNPDGCRELLLWIDQRYQHKVPIVITENGTCENDDDDLGNDIGNDIDDTASNLVDDSTSVKTVQDDARRNYFEGYIRACGEAIDRG